MFHFLQKGHHGYINRKKKVLFGEVLFILAGIIGFVAIGAAVSGSRKNLLTVVAAVLSVPMVNQLVVLIALWKYKSLPDEDYAQVSEAAHEGLLDTELVITSKTDRSFMVDYALIHEKGVICYCSDRNVQAKKAAEYIDSFMRANSINTEIFIIRDRKNFLKRISTLEPCSRQDCDEKLLKIEGVLRGISI